MALRRPSPRWIALGTLVVLPLVTALDGRAVAAHTAIGQPLAVAVTLAWWAACWLMAPPRLRVLLVVGIVAATLGEVFFSLVLGMYAYRLGSIPVYVPPGHTLLYATVYVFVRRPWARRSEAWLGPLLLAVGAAFSALWLVRWNDRFGFGCFVALALLALAARRARLFFSAMGLLVAYLELLGTGFGAWAWPPTLLGRFPAIPSANPPSGIAIFYVLFDLSCLLLYAFVRFESFERWVSARLHAARRPRRSGGTGAIARSLGTREG